MQARTRLSIVVGTVIALTTVASAAPADDAIAAYRAYVTAIRAGDAAAVAKLVSAVPATSRAYLDASIGSAIAVEAVKTEMVKQFGAPDDVEAEGWNLGLLPDAVLATLAAVVQDENTIGLGVKDPRGDAVVTVGWAVRENGAWKVAAGLVLGLEPAPTFVEPPAEERAQGIAMANAIVKASEVVLGKLRAKAYPTAVEVQSALGDEMMKAAGGTPPAQPMP